VILTPKQVFEKILNGEEIDFFPNIIPINPPFVDIMKEKNIYWPDAHRDAKLMSGLASACHEILSFNAVNVPFDMTVEAEALGCEVVWKDGISSTPQVLERHGEDESLLNFGDNVLEKGRFPVVFEALSLLHKKYGGNIPIFSFIEGPFTLAGYIIGLNRIYKTLIKEPKKARSILEQLCSLQVSYARKQLASGADSVIVLDPNAMGLTAKHFMEFIFPLYHNFTRSVDCPLVLHICGNVSKILDYIPGTGFAAFSFDYPAVQLESVKKAFGNKMKIVGSVPTISHLLNGTRDDVFRVSLQMIEGGVDFLAPSCFTAPETPLGNVKAMIEAIDLWNSKDRR
jgi:MtaA/CmuA family methyltransferase